MSCSYCGSRSWRHKTVIYATPDKDRAPVCYEPNSAGKVTVVMSTCDDEKRVEKAIRSVLNQTYENLELFIVDDASSDKTREIIKSFSDPRIKFHYNRVSKGTHWVRNFAISQTQSEYIAFQGADDWSEPQRLERLIAAINKARIPMAVNCVFDEGERDKTPQDGTLQGGENEVELFAPPKQVAHRTIRSSIKARVGLLRDGDGRTGGEETINKKSMVFKRSILNALGYFDLHLAQPEDEFLDRYKRIFPGPLVTKERLYYTIDRPAPATAQYDKLDMLVDEYRYWVINNDAVKQGRSLRKAYDLEIEQPGMADSASGRRKGGETAPSHDKKADPQHFLLTRFNIGLYNCGRKDRSGRSVKEHADDWMEHRLQIFENVCLASIQSQTSQSFSWLVAFDKNTPDRHRDRIERYRQRYGNFIPVFGEWEGGDDLLWGDFFKPFIAERLRDDARYLITTRLDNDDALNVRFIETVQRMFCGQEYSIINFIRGYCYHFGSVYTYKHYKSPFLSLIERIDRSGVTPGFNTVMSRMHTDFDDYSHDGKFFDFDPMWLQYIHARNLANTAYGVKMDVAGDHLRRGFGVRL